MKRLLTAVVLVPLVLLAVFRAPWWLLPILIALVIVLALHEYLKIVRAYEIKPVAWAVYPAGILIVVVMAAGTIFGDFLASGGWGILFLLALACALPVIFRKDLRGALLAAAASGFAIVYIAFPMALVFRARFQDPSFLIFILFSVWAGDIAAYYVGSLIGRHKLAPVVSPKKSWEGAVASLAASIGMAFLVFRFGNVIGHYVTGESLESFIGMGGPYPWKFLIFLGLVTNIAAQTGDLFESALKRGAQIKDSGSLLPGHGGVLDRIDALLFAIPVAWYYASIVQLVRTYLFPE